MFKLWVFVCVGTFECKLMLEHLNVDLYKNVWVLIYVETFECRFMMEYFSAS